MLWTSWTRTSQTRAYTTRTLRIITVITLHSYNNLYPKTRTDNIVVLRAGIFLCRKVSHMELTRMIQDIISFVTLWKSASILLEKVKM